MAAFRPWYQFGHFGEGQQSLRFVAAVIARFSGDKSDKEESAGAFGAMGIVGYGCGSRWSERQRLLS